MKGLSITPLPAAASQAGQSSAKGKLEAWLERAKNHWARSVTAFFDRLDYEEAYGELAKLPVTDPTKVTSVKAILIHSSTQTVLRLSGNLQQVFLDEQGKVSIQDAPAASSYGAYGTNAGNLYQIRLLAEGLQVQQSSSVRNYIANDFVMLGSSRFVLKILNSAQGAEYVHC